MGYYAAGDPGLFDFFESQANKMFTSAARSTGNEWHPQAGQLSLGRVYSQYIKPIASYIPVVGQALQAGEAIYGGLSGMADQFGSVGNYNSPAMSDASDDVLSYARPPRAKPLGYSTAYDDDDQSDYADEAMGGVEDFPDDGWPAGEYNTVHTFGGMPPVGHAISVGPLKFGMR